MTNKIQDFSNSLDEINAKENWTKVDQELKKKFKHQIKKILLISPPQFQTSFIDLDILKNKRYFNYPPYGLGLLRKSLVEKGYDVKILDLNFELLALANTFVDNPKKLNLYMKQYKTKSNTDKNYLNYEYDEKSFKLLDRNTIQAISVNDLMIPKLDEILEKFKPDIAGITCMFTMTHNRMIRIAQRVKKICNNAVVFAGGVHPTSSAELILKEEKSIDFISLYEGDQSFPQLIDYVNRKNNDTKSVRQTGILINGKYYQTDGRIAPAGNNVNIKPEYGDLDIKLYSNFGEIGAYRFWWKKNTVASTILSNRGCRARCSFCSVRSFNGKGVRGRSLKSVVDELQFLKEYHGVNHVMWLDDDLLFDRERTIGMFNEIVKRNLNITWDASNGIIASALKDEVLDAAATSGCIGMHFGIESGSDKVLREVHKPSGKKHYLALEHKLKKYPQIFTKGFLMVGFPNETLAQIKETIDMAVQINLDWYTIQVVHPLPKTEMHTQMVQMGEIIEDEVDAEKLNYGNRTGKLKEREDKEKKNAKEFNDVFIGNLDRLPMKTEMEDIWFTSDYKINYERLNFITEPKQLNKLNIFLKYVGDYISQKNPLINHFRSVIAEKLKKNDEANQLKELSKISLANSEYWKKRFVSLNIH